MLPSVRTIPFRGQRLGINFIIILERQTKKHQEVKDFCERHTLCFRKSNLIASRFGGREISW